MRRRIATAALPAAAIAYAWSRLEREPHVLDLVAVAAVGLAAALPRCGRRAGAIGALTTLSVALLVLGPAPARAGRTIERGLREFYAVALPFDGGRHAAMHALVLVAVTGFATALALAARRSALAVAVVAVVGAGWPATIAPGRDTVAIGAIALVAALWPFAAARMSALRTGAPAAAALIAVVALSSAAAAAGAKPTDAAVGWERWNVFGTGTALDVGLVWDASYGGIDFPARPTTVLEIKAPRRSVYWRATTLDTFVGDRWLESLYTRERAGGDHVLPFDPLLPSEARSERDWIEQEVEVKALVDGHLVAATQAMKLASADTESVRYLSGGVMSVARALRKGQRYTVWSYVPRPSPESLAESPARYPAEVRRYLDLGRAVPPAFGVAGRADAVERLFHDQLYEPLWPYRGMWQETQRLTRGAASPYATTVAIERWLRDDGGFAYDEHPPAPAALPPLADFVVRTKRGYCQHFAGAMALMLRMAGVPARVSVGFTSGEWESGTWTVTDRNAHAWVEAWFAGYGWLAFDPTPGRGTLSASYTIASDSADARRALGGGLASGVAGAAPGALDAATGTATPGATERATGWPLLLIAVLLVLPLVILAGLKAIRRRLGYGGGDPRAVAAGARAELAAFLRDQGADIRADAPVAELRREAQRLGVAADAFAAAFARARYGPPDSAVQAADEARSELAALVSALRARLGAGRRLRGLLALRSLRGA